MELVKFLMNYINVIYYFELMRTTYKCRSQPGYGLLLLYQYKRLTYTQEYHFFHYCNSSQDDLKDQAEQSTIVYWLVLLKVQVFQNNCKQMISTESEQPIALLIAHCHDTAPSLSHLRPHRVYASQ